jgi:Carboxypeptidase regulatory-like domain
MSLGFQGRQNGGDGGRTMRAAAVLVSALALAWVGFASDSRGAVEGTVTGADNRGLQNVAVEIDSPWDGSASHTRRFKVRTDERGHFIYSGLPEGTYLVSVLGPGGEVVRQIAGVEVQAGSVVNVDPKLAGIPPFLGKKQPKASAPPAQADVVKGCVAIRGIVFQRFRYLRSGSMVRGVIENGCGREARVSIGIEMFDATGSSIYLNFVDKLVSPGTLEFSGGPDQNSNESFSARAGRVTSVLVSALP